MFLELDIFIACILFGLVPYSSSLNVSLADHRYENGFKTPFG